MRKPAIILACVALAACVVSCGKGKDAPERTTIAVIPKGTTHEFWKSIHAGAVKAARELDVDIIWQGPTIEDDREAQITVVENMITRGVSGIVLAPLDDAALRAPVAESAREGIPVVIIDSGLKGEDYASFIATDNYKGGNMAGTQLAKLLEGNGKVVMLRYQEGSASTMKRERGFLDAIAEHKGIEIVSKNQYGGPTTESAIRASENLLTPLKTEAGLSIDGIFCPNESTTFGMLRALQNSGLAGKVRFVGFDTSTKLVDALAKGEIDALILQDPIRMGYLGVKTMVRHLAGEKIKKGIATGVALATRKNMNQPDMKKLLNPDFAKWLKEE